MAEITPVQPQTVQVAGAGFVTSQARYPDIYTTVNITGITPEGNYVGVVVSEAQPSNTGYYVSQRAIYKIGETVTFMPSQIMSPYSTITVDKSGNVFAQGIPIQTEVKEKDILNVDVMGKTVPYIYSESEGAYISKATQQAAQPPRQVTPELATAILTAKTGLPEELSQNIITGKVEQAPPSLKELLAAQSTYIPSPKLTETEKTYAEAIQRVKEAELKLLSGQGGFEIAQPRLSAGIVGFGASIGQFPEGSYQLVTKPVETITSMPEAFKESFQMSPEYTAGTILGQVALMKGFNIAGMPFFPKVKAAITERFFGEKIPIERLNIGEANAQFSPSKEVTFNIEKNFAIINKEPFEPPVYLKINKEVSMSVGKTEIKPLSDTYQVGKSEIITTVGKEKTPTKVMFDINKVTTSETPREIEQFISSGTLQTGKESQVFALKGISSAIEDEALIQTRAQASRVMSKPVFSEIPKIPSNILQMKAWEIREIIRATPIKERILLENIISKNLEGKYELGGYFPNRSYTTGFFSPKTGEITLDIFAKDKPATILHEATHMTDIRKFNTRTLYGYKLSEFNQIQRDFIKLARKEGISDKHIWKYLKSEIAEQYPKIQWSGELLAQFTEKFPQELVNPTTKTGFMIRQNFQSRYRVVLEEDVRPSNFGIRNVELVYKPQGESVGFFRSQKIADIIDTETGIKKDIFFTRGVSGLLEHGEKKVTLDIVKGLAKSEIPTGTKPIESFGGSVIQVQKYGKPTVPEAVIETVKPLVKAQVLSKVNLQEQVIRIPDWFEPKQLTITGETGAKVSETKFIYQKLPEPVKRPSPFITVPIESHDTRQKYDASNFFYGQKTQPTIRSGFDVLGSAQFGKIREEQIPAELRKTKQDVSQGLSPLNRRTTISTLALGQEQTPSQRQIQTPLLNQQPLSRQEQTPSQAQIPRQAQPTPPIQAMRGISKESMFTAPHMNMPSRHGIMPMRFKKRRRKKIRYRYVTLADPYSRTIEEAKIAPAAHPAGKRVSLMYGRKVISGFGQFFPTARQLRRVIKPRKMEKMKPIKQSKGNDMMKNFKRMVSRK
jgi:hypothetical protein